MAPRSLLSEIHTNQYYTSVLRNKLRVFTLSGILFCPEEQHVLAEVSRKRIATKTSNKKNRKQNNINIPFGGKPTRPGNSGGSEKLPTRQFSDTAAFWASAKSRTSISNKLEADRPSTPSALLRGWEVIRYNPNCTPGSLTIKASSPFGRTMCSNDRVSLLGLMIVLLFSLWERIMVSVVTQSICFFCGCNF